MSPELSTMGPLALCVVVILREFVAAWKWQREISRKTETESLVSELRPVLENIQTTMATGKMTVEQLSSEVREGRGTAEKMWRGMYESLALRHDDHIAREQERLSGLCSKCADALEATETVLGLVLERLEVTNDR